MVINDYLGKNTPSDEKKSEEKKTPEEDEVKIKDRRQFIGMFALGATAIGIASIGLLSSKEKTIRIKKLYMWDSNYGYGMDRDGKDVYVILTDNATKGELSRLEEIVDPVNPVITGRYKRRNKTKFFIYR